MSVHRMSDVFLDVCTQRDYLSTCGTHRALNAERARDNIKHLMAFARWAGVPTLSCVDVCRPRQACGKNGTHCVGSHQGQGKIPYSLLPDHVVVDSDNCLCVPLDLLQQHQQAILVKEHRDPFTNPKLDRLLTELHTRRYVIFGVSLETSIRLLVLGLLLRHRRVTLVTDACGYWSAAEADMALRQLAAKGCHMVTARELIESRRARVKRPKSRLLGHRRRRFVA